MTYYRWHRTGIEPFGPDHAWSGLWGSDFSPDGSQTRCPQCEGTGEDWQDCTGCHGDPEVMPDCAGCDGAGVIDRCAGCDGDGWQDCVRGYSACSSAAELKSYMSARGGVDTVPPDDHEGSVIAFSGYAAGIGFDGEPCVIPNKIVSIMAWSEFNQIGKMT